MDIENATALVTAAAALIALLYSSKQIRLSNKQLLFDRRFKIFQFVNGLNETINSGSNLQSLDNKDKIDLINDFEFGMLLNNPDVERID